MIITLLRNEILHAPYGNCVGMAATQLGYDAPVFIALGEVFVAPQISVVSPQSERRLEACYSLPRGSTWSVRRPATIDANWVSESGRWESQTLSGFRAQVFLHEYDHLIGITCAHQYYGLLHPDPRLD